jgi:hypothetical protein
MMVIPPAPWHSRVDALLWFHAAAPAARAALPAPLQSRAGPPITIGGLISYRDGPVGPYGELFGAPVMLRGAGLLSHVAFMAVDSEASVAGGRTNWALPKILAEFDGDPGRPGVVTACGEDWELRVAAAARARRLPFFMTVHCDQVWADGQARRFSVRVRGRAALAHVEVQHRAPAIGWLCEGRHPALFIAGTQVVSAPRQ